jgi:hypothetical protein
MKMTLKDILVFLICFATPALFLLILHLLQVPYFIPLRNSGDGQVWFVLVMGELLYLISRFIRRR